VQRADGEEYVQRKEDTAERATEEVLPDNFTLGIVGTGLMGRGIAQIAAQAGITTLMYDADARAAASARQGIADTLQRLADKGKLRTEDVARAVAKLQPVTTMNALAPCSLVIEAVVEDLDVKQALFKALEAIVAPDCVLATNTSSLSVTAIASACARPERCGGFHFFSPVPLMKVVEIIGGVRTEPRVRETLTALARRMGHTPVHAADTPGFIVNHAGRAYGTEALRILSEGVAPFDTIDRILKEGAGFRMGPFALMDLTGLDVSQPVMDSIYHQFYEEPRFRPSPILLQRKIGGLLGRKSGKGFYAYADGSIQPVAPPPLPAVRPARVWISRADPEAHARIAQLVAKLGANVDSGERASAEALCVVMPLGADATTATLAGEVDPKRTVAIDACFGLSSHRTLMTTPVTTPAMRDAAHGLFGSDGVPVSVIRDSAGFVAQRVVAHIVNVACDIAQQRIATPGDIEQAVTLGLGYPQGPLAMGDALGAATVLAILDAMHALYRDPRYRPSPWLTRRAKLGISLLTIDS
jgi:3-hydroxybutyryl-CoA dehydrogenase